VIQDREQWLADTFKAQADTLIDDFDVNQFLSTLVHRMQELLEASEVGLMLDDEQGTLRVMASTAERMRLLEQLEVQTRQGPCFDCYGSGEAVLNVDLRGAFTRWPDFTPVARAMGFRLAHALPMRLRGQVIGAVNIFHTNPITPTDRDIDLAQALADIATIGLLQERIHRATREQAAQLQNALSQRVVIEQATGAVAERAGVDLDIAFGWLCDYARQNHLHLSDVASGVVAHTVPFETLTTISTGSDTDETKRRRT
jgi:GAF domain-containing protein